MATFSQSTIEKGSDTIQDFCCSTCEDMKLEESADFYCETCMKFYCRKCINPHDQLFKKHSPYGREDVKKWPVSKKVEDFLQKCVVHKDKNLEMFCQDHSQLCCNNCAFIDHRLCKTVTLISDYVKYNAIDLQQQSDCIQKILEDMKKLLDNKDASFRSVQSSYEEQVQKIHETRRKINEALDQIEKKTLNEMKDALTKLQSSLKSDVDKCATLRDELKRLRDAIQDICDKSNLDLSFIASRKCHDKIPQAEAYLKGNSVHVQVSITFEPNNEIEEYLSKLSGFGRIENRTQTLTMQGNPDQGEQRPPLPPLSKRDNLNRQIAGAVGRKRVLPPIPNESSRRFAAGDLKGNGNIGATGGVDSQRVALKGLAVDTEDLEGIYSSVPKTLNDFELRRDQIDLQDLLGTGQFGSVCKGTFTLRNGKTITVAVKTFKQEDVTPRQEKYQYENEVGLRRKPGLYQNKEEHVTKNENDLLEEAKIMIKLSHKHILRMFGKYMKMQEQIYFNAIHFTQIKCLFTLFFNLFPKCMIRSNEIHCNTLIIYLTNFL
ncbi:hypothetical protein DPMN_084108 [Dreissena polymorpha]|uniref:B box-type domain-containing protein n=1 Tax=Dreissena polymorpha TaxID=45954 RepID=A0A9D3YDY4_DREPO|nr:hypothetical protein DPMN_084108 [Dreissena polymorpha]